MRTETATGKRILLVEDERIVRESVRSYLTRDDHIVVEANNGAEALALFMNGRFDLVLTDYLIPFISGEELASRIRKLSPQQPIVLITGYDVQPKPRGTVDAVLRKPFDYEQLHEEIERILQIPDQSPMTTALV